MGIEVNLEGKIAFVTGASSGLGDRFARVLSKAGASVVLAARRMDRLKELRAEIEADGGQAHAVALDVTDHASIKAAVAHAETEAGPIDILVNNSGVANTQRLVDVTPDDYDFVMRHEHRRRVLRRAGSREADDRAREGQREERAAREGGADHQHRVGRRAARACRRSACTA